MNKNYLGRLLTQDLLAHADKLEALAGEEEDRLAAEVSSQLHRRRGGGRMPRLTFARFHRPDAGVQWGFVTGGYRITHQLLGLFAVTGRVLCSMSLTAELVNPILKFHSFYQCCGSKYIEFRPGSRVMLSTLKENLKIILNEKNNFLKNKFFTFKEIFSKMNL